MRQSYFLITIVWMNHVLALNYFTNEKSEEKKEPTSSGLQYLTKNEPHYEFKYGVRDPDTGDVKSHWEFRKGDNVEGAYSLVEADGTTRIVRYAADERRGFNAIVSRERNSKLLTPSNHYYRNIFENILPEKQMHIIGAHSYFPLDKTTFVFPQSSLNKNKISLQNQNAEKFENYKRDSYWVPANHKPVYTKLSDHAKLVDMYNLFRKRQSKTKTQKFDYGINEYFANKRNKGGFIFTTRLA